jgi:aryl-alcohol dehydrogenase-like predicted oxidoreductase
LYLHAWDFTTGEQEVMYALEQLVRQGKVLHLGFSDTPAWIVSRCQTIAELRGWSSIIALQVEYSLLERTAERDLTPMAQHLNMGVVAWAPLAGGALTGKYLSDLSAGRLKPESKRLDSRAVGIVTKLVEIAGQKNCSPAQAALAWLRQKSGLVIPLVGARNATQLKESIESVSIVLTEQEITSLNGISEIDYGFPHTFLASDAVKDVLFGGMYSKIKR